MIHILRGTLANLMAQQRIAPEGALGEQWRLFADWLLANRDCFSAEAARRGIWHHVELAELCGDIRDVADDMMAANMAGARFQGLLSMLWVSMSNQTGSGYLIRVRGQNYKLCVRLLSRETAG